MSTYGMSAKDRMAMFQAKTEDKKGPGKKIGKLNIPGNGAKKELAKNDPPKKLPAKKPVAKKESLPKEKKEEPKPVEKKEEPKLVEKKEEPKPVQKKEEPKPVEKKEEPKPVEKKPESKPVEKKEEPKPVEKKEEPKPVEKKEEPKPVEKKPEPKPVEKKEEPKPAEKKEEPKKVEKKEEPKPAEKNEEPKPVEKKQQPKLVEKKEEPKPVEKKEEAKPVEKKAEPQPEPTKQAAPQPEPPKQAAPKPEPPKQAAPKPEPPKQAAPKHEPPKQVAPKPEPTKQAAPKPEAPKQAAPKPAPQPKSEIKPSQAKEAPKPAEAPKEVVEEVIDVVVVERKPKPVDQVVVAKIDEDLPQVTMTPKSKPVKKSAPQQQAVVEVVEEVIEVVPVKKAEQAPAPAPAPPRPKPVVKTIKPMQMLKPSGDDFYNTIFYFSGMGSVVGSSLSKGIFVPENLTKTSLDVAVVETLENYKSVEQKRRDTVVESARNQAVELTEELKKLRALLFGLPSWGQESNDGVLDAGSLQRVGGEAPMKMSQPQLPAPWQNTHEGLDLISQANTVMAQTLPPPKPQLGPPRPSNRPRSPGPPAPPVSAPAPPPPMAAFVSDPLALASSARAAAARRPRNEAPPPPKGGVNMYGVFQGDLANRPDNTPWQERYGNKPRSTAMIGAGGDIDSKGLKPWQASRLRGLEAKGYEFRQQPTKTGADFGGDAFCGAKATIELQREDDVASYTPYLVSGKTKAADMRMLLHEGGMEEEPKMFSSFAPSSTFRTPAPPPQLPYCDL